MTIPDTTTVLMYLVLGSALGFLYMAILNLNVRAYTVDPFRGWPAYVLHGARAVVMAAILWAVAQQGAAQLVAACAGLLVARTLVLQREEERNP